MNLSEFLLPTVEWNHQTWYAGHFYSGRSKSSAAFDPKKNGRAHTGHDQAAPWGTPIVAPADGTVIRAKYSSGIGHNVVIDHGDVFIDVPAVGAATFGETATLFSRHGHMAPDRWWQKKRFFVKAGDVVEQGALLGIVGSSGASAGPHNHTSITVGVPEYQSWKKDKHIDPELVYTGTSPGYYYLDGGIPLEAVKGLQRLVTGQGYDPGPIDGRWGTRTEDAWEAYMADSLSSSGGTPNLTFETVEVVRTINLGD